MNDCLALLAQGPPEGRTSSDWLTLVLIALAVAYILYAIRRHKRQQELSTTYMARVERHMETAEAHMRAMEEKLDQIASQLSSCRE